MHDKKIFPPPLKAWITMRYRNIFWSWYLPQSPLYSPPDVTALSQAQLFPLSGKKSLINPLLKTPTRLTISDTSPVAILPEQSKIFEKAFFQPAARVPRGKSVAGLATSLLSLWPQHWNCTHSCYWRHKTRNWGNENYGPATIWFFESLRLHYSPTITAKTTYTYDLSNPTITWLYSCIWECY